MTGVMTCDVYNENDGITFLVENGVQLLYVILKQRGEDRCQVVHQLSSVIMTYLTPDVMISYLQSYDMQYPLDEIL